MFIVKAEARQDAGPQDARPQSYQLYATEAVRVGPHCGAQSHGPSPELEVELIDVDGRTRKTLYVGPGLDHYCAVYIMNAQGKTVDSVESSRKNPSEYPGPRSLAACEVSA